MGGSTVSLKSTLEVWTWSLFTHTLPNPGNDANGWKCDPDNCQRRIQNDETALAVDMGYYLDFTVDPETGRPGGCPSFETKAGSINYSKSVMNRGCFQ